MFRLTLAPLVFSLLAAAPPPRPGEAYPGDVSDVPISRRPDLELLQGQWRLAAEIKDGRSVAVTKERANAITVGRNMWTTQKGNAFEITLREDRSPREIDWKSAKSGTLWRGIYKLTTDELVICLGGAGKERPKYFHDAPARGIRLHIRRRVPRQNEGSTGDTKNKKEPNESDK